MPLKRFRPLSGKCRLCKGELELKLAGNAESPSVCPKCGQGIEPIQNLSAPPARINRKPSPTQAKAAGFQVYKRLGKGEYEKQ
ncbi:MAG TPA: hypothetical protein DIV79_04450 [Opitutae bacterium]|nr:hypothetical protein [Opitutaceae bacterium]HCR29250.1 hypothetical protein [Opitutae bacterium]